MEQTLTKSTQHATAENEIRALVERFLRAVRTRDVEAIMAHYADDVVAFDAISKLQFKGADAYGRHWKYCMSLCEGPMIFEIHDLHVEARDDLAFCRFLTRCGAADDSGEEKTSWMRATVCCRKTQGQWRIVHEHYSAPFDIESGKALLDIQP